MRPHDLVLLPGLNCTSAVFDAVTPRIASSIRTHALDLPPLDSVEALADDVLARSPERFWLGGFSFGGYVAMAVLDRAPERVLGLALICSSAGADTPQASARRRESIATARQGGYEEMASSATAPFHPDSLGKPELVETRRRIIRAYGAERYIAHSHACIARPDRTRLLDGKRPTLFVTAAQDVVVPHAMVRALADSVPGAAFAEIEGAGHLLPLEQPQALAATLSRWIEETRT